MGILHPPIYFLKHIYYLISTKTKYDVGLIGKCYGKKVQLVITLQPTFTVM